MMSSKILDKTIISDAGPLIALSRINFLSFLEKMFGEIILTKEVALECTQDISREGAIRIKEAIERKIIKIDSSVLLSECGDLLEILDEGEATSIVLASKINAALVIDERLGRNVAQKMQLNIIGTAGILLLAKENKLIKAVNPFLLELQKIGYYLSDKLILKVLKQAKEEK